MLFIAIDTAVSEKGFLVKHVLRGRCCETASPFLCLYKFDGEWDSVVVE